jgi:hypothetical protein
MVKIYLSSTNKTDCHDIPVPEKLLRVTLNSQHWGRYKNVAGLNWLMGSQPSPLDNWISNIQYTDSLSLKKTTY